MAQYGSIWLNMATQQHNSSHKTQFLIWTLTMSLTVSNSKNVYSPTSPRYSPTSPSYSPSWHEEQESKARSVEENPWKKSLLRRLELQYPESDIGFNCNSRNCMGNCSTWHRSVMVTCCESGNPGICEGKKCIESVYTKAASHSVRSYCGGV